MQTRNASQEQSLVGPYAAIGAALGLVFAVLNGSDGPIVLVIGAAVGLLVGLVVDALATSSDGEPKPGA